MNCEYYENHPHFQYLCNEFPSDFNISSILPMVASFQAYGDDNDNRSAHDIVKAEALLSLDNGFYSSFLCVLALVNVCKVKTFDFLLPYFARRNKL